MSRELKDSGIKWIGQIPSDWNCCKQKYEIQLLNGRAYKDSEFEENGKYRVLRVGNLFTNPTWYTSSLELEPEKYCCNGDLLYAWSMSYAPFIWSGDKVIFHYHIWKAILSNNIDKKFAFYYLSTITEALKAEIHETTMGFITMGIMNNSYIVFPELHEQRQIASFLDRKCSAIDTAIEKTKKSIEKLEEYKKAVITKAVTKGLDPDTMMKDSGVEWIGEVPEMWGVKQLRKFYSRRLNKNKYLQEKNLLSLSYGNIIRKNIDTKEGLLPESFDGYNIVEADDIVIRGTDLQNDHRSLRTGLVKERGIITSAYMTLKPKAGVNSEYYHYLLHCYDIEKVFYSMGGGLRQSLDYWDFVRTYVLVPSEQEQTDIVNYIHKKCASVDSLIAKKQEAINKWEEYKKSLIYYAVTGKIDCRNEVV